jgi:hypothetical protein
VPSPPDRFARLLPAGIDLDDAQLAELRQIERLANKNVGAAVAAWNAWLKRHNIGTPQRPPSDTGTALTWIERLRHECHRALLVCQRVTRVGLRADWHGIVRRLYDIALEVAPAGHIPPPFPTTIDDEAAGRQAVAVLLDWLMVAEGGRAGSDHVACYVTLLQIAAIAHRSKRTLEKWKTRKCNPLPDPDTEGGGGEPALWEWDRIRPWLVEHVGIVPPMRFPADRFSDGRTARA